MSETPDAPDGSGGLRRACDPCRIRKVRCDKETPCSNCRIARRECSWTSLGRTQKPREAKQRVLISHQYERKIDRFESRLAGIEDLLRNLTTSIAQLQTPVLVSSADSTSGSANATPAPIYSSHSATESSTAYQDSQPDEETHEAFEGNSSMTAHTVLASEYVEHAVTTTPLDQQLSPDIQNALESLRKMVRMQDGKRASHESRFAHQKALPAGGVSRLPLPPTDAVVTLLREIKAEPPMTFMMSCSFLTVEDFVGYCRKVYFATEDYSMAIFIIANAGLYYLFQEKAVMDESRSEEYLKYRYLCRDNLETTLANLPLLLPPRKETIEALLLGVTYSIEISKPTLAYQLNTAAATMCQALGWHRPSPSSSPTFPTDTASSSSSSTTKSALFWFCYMLDKGLSLRFGRTSAIQDFDLSLPRTFGNASLQEPWQAVINVWICTGSILGETYEHLYSPAALARPPEQRIETATRLADKMKGLWGQLEALKREGSRAMLDLKSSTSSSVADSRARDGKKDKEYRDATMEMVLKSGEVGHLASLTLIYRAIPSAPGTFHAECIEAARKAFERHGECVELTSHSLFAQAGYLHWTILYAPFTPFIVLFCHVIQTSNTDDLARLDQFAATLQPAAHMSRGIEKLHRLCTLLCRVAALYVEAKSAAQRQNELEEEQDQDMAMVGNNLDMYLSRLGFLPLPQEQQYPLNETSSNDLANPDGGDYGLENGSLGPQLGDWFSGNRYIMGLMEGEDLFDFDEMDV